MNEKSVWNLIMENLFEDACIQADEEYRLTPTRFSPLRNKGLALMNLNRYEEVIQLCHLLIEAEHGESSTDFKYAGIAHWFLNQHKEAIELWRKSKNTKYQDAAGGVTPALLLLFASLKLQDTKLEKEAVSLLKKKAKSKLLVNWPGPLANYMLSEIDEENLLKQINEQPSLKARQTCQALFYIALNKLKSSDVPSYHDLLRRCVSQDPVSRLEQEYYLAKGELDVLVKV
jgi:lipoprotein NlpI